MNVKEYIETNWDNATCFFAYIFLCRKRMGLPEMMTGMLAVDCST